MSTHPNVFLKWVFILLPLSLVGQQDTWINGWAGPRINFIQVNDEGGLIIPLQAVSINYGITFTHQLTKRWYLETGLVKNTFAFNSKFEGHYKQNPDFFDNKSIPLRIGYNLISTDEDQFSAHIGGALFINEDYGPGGFGSGKKWNSLVKDTLNYRYIYRVDLVKYFGMMESGISARFLVKPRLAVSFMANFQVGFRKIWSNDVRYSAGTSPEFGAEEYSFGTGLQMLLGLSYKLGTKSNVK